MSHQPHQYRGPGPKAVADFVDRHGWRAYALPALTLLTMIALFRAGGGHSPAEAMDHQAAAYQAATHPTGPTATATTATATTATVPNATAPTATAARPSTQATGRPVRPARVRRVTLAPDPAAPGKQHDKQAGPPTSARCRGNSSAHKVVVSIAAQHAWMCAHSSLVYSSAVTTGKSASGHATPTGTFRVQGNVTDTTLNGSGYSVHVAYWIPFNGDIGFHDASWQTMKFGSADYPTQGSRGCVHMPLPTIAWLHKWVRVGKTVVVVRKS